MTTIRFLAVGLTALLAAATVAPSAARAQTAAPTAQQPYPQQTPPQQTPPPQPPPPGQYQAPPPGQYPPPPPGQYQAPPAGQYPPPPPGQPYPQQPYPQYPPQQYPAYPQQQAYPQYPPQQYPYPPPYQQPYPPQPPPVPVAPRPPGPRTHGFFALGYVGFQTYQGSASSDNIPLKLTAGPRLGGLAGLRVIPEISINGELTLDIPHAELAGSTGTSIDASRFSIGLSPLYHLDLGAADLVLGPKLSVWATTFTDNSSLDNETATYQGWSLGAQVGVFYKVARVGLGGMLAFDYARTTKICNSSDFASETCDSSPHVPADKLLTFVLAIIF